MERKNTFGGFINKLDTAKNWVSELEEMSTETSKAEIQREEGMKKSE